MSKRLYPLSSLRSRAFAVLIDYGIYLLLVAAYVLWFGKLTEEGNYAVSGWETLPVFVGWFLYFPLSERLLGQTLGKIPFGLRIIRTDLKPLTLWTTTQRRLADMIDIGLYGIPAYLTIRKSVLGQWLGDIWAGTRVVADEQAVCGNCGAAVELQGEEVVTRGVLCPDCNGYINGGTDPTRS